MAELHGLAAELVVHVLQYLVIDDILSLRLTSSRLRLVIDANINSIAYLIARNTFPRARLLLRKPEHGTYDFRWLKSLIPARLAAIVLDKDKCFPWRGNYSTGDRVFDGLPAEDDKGDGLRTRVANGWRVLQRISNIYRDVYAQRIVSVQEDKIPWLQDRAGHKWSESDQLVLNAVSQREYAVWIKTVSLILQLQPHDCEDFLFLFRPLAEAFRTPKLQEWRYSMFYPHEGAEIPYFLDCAVQRPRETHFCQFPVFFADETQEPKGNPKWRHFDRGNSWLTACILREGPSLFWEQWQQRPSNERVRVPDFPDDRIIEPRPDSDANAHYIRNRIQEAWKQRSPAAVYVERECASYIWYALFHRACKEPIVPPARYNTLLDSPINNKAEIMRKQVQRYRKWFFGQYGGLISDSEWSWHEWQRGVISIDEDSEIDKDWVRERAPKTPMTELEDEFFQRFDSLDDVNYYIWL